MSDLRKVDAMVAELHFDQAPAESLDGLVEKLNVARFRSQIFPGDSNARAFLIAKR